MLGFATAHPNLRRLVASHRFPASYAAGANDSAEDIFQKIE